MCIADRAQIFLAGGLWGGTRQLVTAAKTPCPRAATPGAEAAAEHWDQAGGLTSVVAAACLDSSLRWLSILSTFASSSALM